MDHMSILSTFELALVIIFGVAGILAVFVVGVILIAGGAAALFNWIMKG